MAKSADPRIKLIKISLKESLAKQNVQLSGDQMNGLITDVFDILSLSDCGGGGCKVGCNSGCLDGCKDVSKTS